jgi:hypothetical protein
MKSATPGTDTLAIHVGDVSPTGFRLLVGKQDLFVAFAEFPWFVGARREQIANVELHPGGHLYWPQLDVDLSVECIEHPERFPLKIRSAGPRRRPS